MSSTRWPATEPITRADLQATDAFDAEAAQWTQRVLSAATRGEDDHLAALLLHTHHLGARADSKGGKPLLCLAGHVPVSVVKGLIDARACVDETDDDARTALMEATAKGCVETVQELLKDGSVRNVKGCPHKMDALDWAVCYNNPDVAKELLCHAASTENMSLLSKFTVQPLARCGDTKLQNLLEARAVET